MLLRGGFRIVSNAIRLFQVRTLSAFPQNLPTIYPKKLSDIIDETKLLNEFPVIDPIIKGDIDTAAKNILSIQQMYLLLN